MTRLLFVRRTYGFGGTEVILLEWLKRIDYSRYDVFVSSPADVFSERIHKAGLPARFIHLNEPETTRIYGRYQPLQGINDLVNGSFWHFFPIWLRFLRRVRPDAVVFVDGDFFSTPLACVLAAYFVARGNVSMTVHSPAKLEQPLAKTTRSHLGLPGLGLWWYGQVWWPLWPWRMRARLVKRVLTASAAIGEKIVRFYDYPAAKVDLLNNGVDTVRFRPSEAIRTRFRQEQGIPRDAFVIVSTSRFSYEKNIDWVLRGFEEIASRNDHVWLLLAGDGPLRGDVEAFLRHCPQSGRVRLLGHLEDVSEVLQASDCYLLSSSFEGSPVALIEAMAVGLVCMVSNIPGPNEVIDDSRDGLLIDSSKAGVLAGLQRALILTPSERDRLARCAREKVTEHYELEKSVKSAFRKLGIEPGQITAVEPERSNISSVQEVAR